MINTTSKYYTNCIIKSITEKYYLSLITLPYLLDLYSGIIIAKPLPEEPSLLPEISLLICALVTIDFTYQKGLKLSLKYISINLNIIIVPSLIIFLYTLRISEFFNLLNSYTLNIHEIHARYYIPILWILIAVGIKSSLNKQYYLIRGFNLFLIVISLTIVLNSIKNEIKINCLKMMKQRSPIKVKNKSISSIILIILDEYESPEELFKVTNDSSVFELSNYIEKLGGTVKNKQTSLNELTVNSISSLFNYNFNKTDKNLTFRSSLYWLYNSNLERDLLNDKKIPLINFGIFDIGNQNAFNKIYYYDSYYFKNDFLKTLAINTIFPIIINSKDVRTDISIKHNSTIIEQIPDRISQITKNHFVYVHLLMPHYPFVYEGKINFGKLSTQYNLTDYLKYYKYTNQKIINEFLPKIIKSGKFRIIISGDHGFRGLREKVSPKYTATYYLGFNKNNTAKIKSVQDLGNFIYTSY